MKSRVLEEVKKEKLLETKRYDDIMTIIDDYVLTEFNANKSDYIALDKMPIKFDKESIESIKSEIMSLYDNKTSVTIDELNKFIKYYTKETCDCISINYNTAFNNESITLEIDIKKICGGIDNEKITRNLKRNS